MKIAIIGSGNVGKALAGSSVRSGHTVTISSRDPKHAEDAAKATGARATATSAEAVSDADLVVLAVPYTATESIVDDLGDRLSGKVVIDVTNRMDPKAPGRTIDGSSVAEQLQARAPKTRVVKAFNTAFASRQASPTVDGVQLDGFVAGDDVDAKAKTLALVASIGFRPIDAGPLAMARALEAMGQLHISLNARNGWPWQSGWKIVGPTG